MTSISKHLLIPGIFQPGNLKNLGILEQLQDILVTCFILCFSGFTLAGLVCYKTVERSVNNSFQYLTDTDTNRYTATATASKPSYQISSKVVTALVSNPATEHLAQPVILTFRHLQVAFDNITYAVVLMLTYHKCKYSSISLSYSYS